MQKKGTLFEIPLTENWNGHTIEDILKKEWQAPKKLVHELRMNKSIQVNGQLLDWKIPLKKGDILQIDLFKPEAYGITPLYSELDVLFEDEHLLVVNKPAGIDTHPNGPDDSETLAHYVAFHLQSQGEQSRVMHVHRLDRDTSGAVLFAKHALSKAILDRLLLERKIKRTYSAIIHGRLKQKKGTIHEPIGRDRHHSTRRRVSPSGQEAITHYTVIKDDYLKKPLTLVEVQLDTGRTHQIRVHFSYIGHPLVGDLLYGGKSLFPRQALHAKRLTFIHPFTNEKIVCEARCVDELPI